MPPQPNVPKPLAKHSTSGKTQPLMNRRTQIARFIADKPGEAADLLLAWETEVGKTMPLDFKSWWENSPLEWPTVTRMVIEAHREQERLALLPTANDAASHWKAGAITRRKKHTAQGMRRDHATQQTPRSRQK